MTTTRKARRAGRMLAGALGVAAALAACKGLPDVTFGDDAGGDAGERGDAGTGGGGDAGDGKDATLPPAGDAGHQDGSTRLPDGGGGDDAGASDAADENPVDIEDAAVPEGGIGCGDGSVNSCTQCPGAPLRCKKGVADQCVADCSSCAVGWLPCWHCTNKGSPRGVCLAVSGSGVLGCTESNLCGCDAAADCPSGGGGSQVCFNDASVPGGGSCATCGEADTNALACMNEDSAGAAGTCSAGTATPTCN